MVRDKEKLIEIERILMSLGCIAKDEYSARKVEFINKMCERNPHLSIDRVISFFMFSAPMAREKTHG